MAKTAAQNTQSRLRKDNRSAVSSIPLTGFDLVPHRKRRGTVPFARIEYLGN
jgi:hypothetical protein